MWHWQLIAQLVIDSSQQRTGDHDPEWIQRLELLRLKRDAENGMLYVADRKEVERGRHLHIEHKEYNRFHHQQKRHNHFAARRTLQRERFFGKDQNNAQSNNAERHARNALVMQQPGGECDQHRDAHDCQQQFAHLQRSKVRLRTVLFHQAFKEQEVKQRDHQPHDGEREGGTPAIFRCQPWRQHHGEQ